MRTLILFVGGKCTLICCLSFIVQEEELETNACAPEDDEQMEKHVSIFY